MFKLTPTQMSTGERGLQHDLVARVAGDLVSKYGVADDTTLIGFVEGRRAMGLVLDFATDRQISEFIEACLLTQDAVLTDAAFQNMMQKSLLRAEAKAHLMLRRYVLPHPEHGDTTIWKARIDATGLCR